MVGYVQRQLEKAQKGTGSDGNATGASRASDGRRLTDHEKALDEYAKAFAAWQEKAFKAILKGINSDPAYRLSWCVLKGIGAFWHHPRMQIPRVSVFNSSATTDEPVLAPLPEAVEQAIRAAFKGNRAAWIELLKDEEQFEFGHFGLPDMPHPRCLELLAEMMQVKLPAMPVWKRPASAAEGAAATPLEVAAK